MNTNPTFLPCDLTVTVRREDAMHYTVNDEFEYIPPGAPVSNEWWRACQAYVVSSLMDEERLCKALVVESFLEHSVRLYSIIEQDERSEL